MRYLLMSLFTFFSMFAMAKPDLSLPTNFSILDNSHHSYHFHVMDLNSQDQQRHYRIYIGIPNHKPPMDGFPVFYALDGNAALSALTPSYLQSLAQQNHAPVIVFIGYRTRTRFDTLSRSFDYIPAHDRHSFNIDELDKTRHWGGAQLFLTIIKESIQPAVAKIAPINQQNQTLWGHSYGGVFVLYTLMTQPNLFQHYITADPSLWVQNGSIFKQAQQFIQQDPQLPPTTLWLINSKQKRPMLMAKKNNQVSNNAYTLSQVFSTHIHGLKVQHDFYPNETHGSLFAKSLLMALSHNNQPKHNER